MLSDSFPRLGVFKTRFQGYEEEKELFDWDKEKKEGQTSLDLENSRDLFSPLATGHDAVGFGLWLHLARSDLPREMMDMEKTSSNTRGVRATNVINHKLQ